MKKIILIILVLAGFKAFSQQEGITLVHNSNNVRLGGTSIPNGSVFIETMADDGKIIVSSSSPQPGSTGNSIGNKDIDITRLDANNNPMWHHIWGTANDSLIPKDVIIDNQSRIVIAGIRVYSLNGVSTTESFILRLTNSNTPSFEYVTYSINGHTETRFHQIIELNLPNSIRPGGEVQYAVLASADDATYGSRTKDFVLLIERLNLSINTITKINLGPNISSLANHHNTMTYKLMTETDPFDNALCVAGCYNDVTTDPAPANDYLVHISKFNFVLGDLVLIDSVTFGSGDWATQGWINFHHMIYVGSGVNQQGTLVLAGNKYESVSTTNLRPCYMAYNSSFVSPDPFYTKYLPIYSTSNPTDYLIRGVHNACLQSIGEQIYFGNNRGDLIYFDVRWGNTIWVKSLTDQFRPVTASPKGDFIYNPNSQLFHGVTLRSALDPFTCFTMLPNNTDGCCFMVRQFTTIGEELHGFRIGYTKPVEGQAENGSISSASPEVTATTACSFCNDNTMTLDGPNDVWCQDVTYTLTGCDHFNSISWYLLGPNPSTTNLHYKIIASNRSSITINFRRNVGPVLTPGTYTLQYFENITSEGNDCQRLLVSRTINFHDLVCTNGVISGNNSISCNGNGISYSFAGCTGFPSGTTYQWTLTNTSGSPQASFNGATNGSSVLIDFASATGTNTYALRYTATYQGCTWTSDPYVINHFVPTFNGVITSIQSPSCNQPTGIFEISNPDGVTITSYSWSVNRSPTTITNGNTYQPSIDFNNLTGTFIITCTLNLNGCIVQKSFTFTRTGCCEITDPQNVFQSSYNAFDPNNAANVYTGRVEAMLTDGNNDNMVLQSITNLTNTFSISEMDNQGNAMSNKLYTPSSLYANSDFTPVDFVESVNTPGGKVVIGHRGNRLYIVEMDASGNMVTGKQKYITLNSNSSGTMEAVSIVPMTYTNPSTYVPTQIGYCVLVNLVNSSNVNSVFLVGVYSNPTFTIGWAKRLSYNSGNTIAIHAHKLIPYLDNYGNTNFVVLEKATFGSASKGIIFDSQINSVGAVGTPNQRAGDNIYFSGTVVLDNTGMPTGFVFGGSTYPTSFDSTTCAAFLRTDMGLNTIEEKFIPHYKLEVLGALQSSVTPERSVFLLQSHDYKNGAKPYFYHLLELDGNLDLLTGSQLQTISNYKNYGNDHNPYMAAKTLMARTAEGGFIVAGQDEVEYDFMLCKVGGNLEGWCNSSFEIRLEDSIDGNVTTGYVQLASAAHTAMGLDVSDIDLEQVCCANRTGPAFSICDIFHAKLNISFTPPHAYEYQNLESILFEAQGNYDPIDVGSYSWNLGDGTFTSSSSNSVMHEYDFIPVNSSQTYNITLKITFDNGCSDSVIQTVTIHKCGTTQVHTSTPPPVCEGACISLIPYEVCTPNSTYRNPDNWYDPNTGLTHPVGSASDYCPPGNVVMKRKSLVMGTSGCTTCINEVHITVIQCLTVPGKDTKLNPSDEKSSNKGNLTSALANEAVNLKDRISIKPNPSDGIYQILYNCSGCEGESLHDYGINILDITGKIVYTLDNLKMNANETINISHLSSGVYTVKIMVNHTLQYIKIIKN